MSTLVEFEAIEHFTGFLANHPSDEEILAFRLPEEIDRRVQDLVSRNSAGTITCEEIQELQEYERLDSYVGLLKTKVMQCQKKTQ